MPQLTAEARDALRADIAKNGILVPIVVDQYDRILDGHNRKQIAEELGINCPSIRQDVADDDEALDLAVTLNCARRHLSREQVRQVVDNELKRRPGDSDRAIARRVGCSPSTVGAVRRPGVSNLDTHTGTVVPSTEDAGRRVAAIQDRLVDVRTGIAALVMIALGDNEIPAAEIVMALTTAQRTYERRASPEASDAFRRGVFTPLIDATMVASSQPSKRDNEDFVPLNKEERRELLAAIASVSEPRG